MVKQSLNTLPAGTFALSFYWTADGSGNVPATLASALPEIAQGMRILQVETVPGIPAPTNGYSIALKNSFGTDLMAGAMVAVSSTANQLWPASSASPPFVGLFSLVINGNVVANAQGVVVVYFAATTIINSNAGSPGPTGPAGPPGPAGDGGGVAVSNDYNFAAQQPGGTLTGGISASVNVNGPIFGLNGTDSNHWLYISGGTGTAEAVLITGGSYVSGAPTGTIIFTPANNHSGAWTIQSATAGIQEALNSGNPSVFISTGNHPIYAPATVLSMQSLFGGGPQSCLLPQSNGMTVINVLANTGHGRTSVSKLSIDGTALALGSGNTIKGILVSSGSFQVLLEALWITNIRNGIFVDASTFNVSDVTVRDVFAYEFTGGYFGNQIIGEPSHLLYNLLVDGWHQHSDTISPPIALEFCGSINTMLHNFVSNDLMGNVGIQLQAHNEGFAFSDSVISHPSTGIWIQQASSLTAQWSQIGPNVLVDQATTQGIQLDTGALFTRILGCYVTNLASGGIGVNIPDTASYVTYGINIEGNYFQGMLGTAVAIQAGNHSQQFIITGNFINGASTCTGISLGTNAVSWIIENNMFEGMTTPFINNSVATNTPQVCADNIGIGFEPGFQLVQVATTIAPTYSSFTAFVGSGGTVINTITVPAGFLAGMSILVNPNNIFTWTTAGNIGIAGTSVIGRLITFLWDGTSWWPSYV